MRSQLIREHKTGPRYQQAFRYFALRGGVAGGPPELGLFRNKSPMLRLLRGAGAPF